MNYFDDIKVLWKEKSWKKLAVFSVCTLLFITVIVFFGAYELSRSIYLKQMEEYLSEIPAIFDSRQNEFQMRSRIYNEDILTRAELGVQLFAEENGLTDAENLKQVRNSVSAASITLLDEKGEILSGTGTVIPKENFTAVIKALKPNEPKMELYPGISEDGKETGKNDGKGFVLLPVPGNRKCSLVFEFACGQVLDLLNDLSDWSGILERMLSGSDAASAYAQTGNELAGYPLDTLTPEQTLKLQEELKEIFRNSAGFRQKGTENSSKIVTLLGNHYLSALMHYPQQNTDILLTFPLKAVVKNVFFIAAAISAIIGWGIVLIRIYIFRSLRREKDSKERKKISLKHILQETWPGILVVILVTVTFSAMLMDLENRTNATYTAATKRESVRNEIDMRKAQEKTIRSTYVDIYRERAQILADFLTEHPDRQTHEDLAELNRIAGTDYLMLFDSTGQELTSSNSYTGFSVDNNLSGEYRAVLMGYPYAVAGPSPDPYTGRMQLGSAIMMKDEEGLPDGFLLAVYNAGDLDAELKRMSYENAVNSFTVQKGHIAAAISEENGRFIAHTDPAMIGLKAEDYLEDFKPGSSFEGFAGYKGENMCISASTGDGKTLLFMIPERWNAYEEAGSLPTILAAAVLLILTLLYYPNASILISQAIEEAEKNLLPDAGKGNRIKVFYDGYNIFLTLFTIFVLFTGRSTSFDYVISGKWSKGVNLFSIWAILLICASAGCIILLIRTVLNLWESHLSLRARTITKLIKSLIFYAAVIFLIFFILDILGVNTTTLLASAGILSIAIGMGAKSIAEDMLAGFFIITEGTVRVGDHVTIGGVTGHVTNMGIRTIEITDEQGNVVTVNNSKVSSVCNRSRTNTQQDSRNASEIE